MTPARAHIGHVPQLAMVLWMASRGAPGLPARARPQLGDMGAMARAARRGWLWYLCDARGPAGFMARDGARLHALYVHPRAQGQGLGSRLIAAAQSGAARLELYVLEENTPARRFYAARGFAEVTRGRGLGNDQMLPDIRMVWRRT